MATKKKRPLTLRRVMADIVGLHNAGYAVRTYNIDNDVQNWLFWNERFRTTAVPTEDWKGMAVAKIEDIRKAANGH